MKLIMGMLGGAVLGAGAALLFAPQSGRKTRGMIRDKAVHFGHETQEFVESKATHLRNKMEGWRHQAGEMVEQAGDFGSMAQDMKMRGQEMVERGQEMFDRGKEALNKAKSAMDGSMQEDQSTAAV